VSAFKVPLEHGMVFGCLSQTYFTRSASVRGCSGSEARREMSWSVTVFVCNRRAFHTHVEEGGLRIWGRGRRCWIHCDWITRDGRAMVIRAGVGSPHAEAERHWKCGNVIP
jgi:hypothetical protein